MSENPNESKKMNEIDVKWSSAMKRLEKRCPGYVNEKARQLALDMYGPAHELSGAGHLLQKDVLQGVIWRWWFEESDGKIKLKVKEMRRL